MVSPRFESLLFVVLLGCSAVTPETSIDSGTIETPSAGSDGRRGGRTLGLVPDTDAGWNDAGVASDSDASRIDVARDSGATDASEPEPDAGDAGATPDGGADAFVLDGDGPCTPCDPAAPACATGLICAQHSSDTEPRCWVPCVGCAMGEQQPCGDYTNCDAAYGPDSYVCWGPQGFCTPYQDGINYSDVPAQCDAYVP